MTDLPRKPGRPPLIKTAPFEPISSQGVGQNEYRPFPEPDHSTETIIGKQEPPEAMVPVKVLRGYWPKGVPGDVEFGDVELPNPHTRIVEGEKPTDPKRLKILPDALCMMPEAEAQQAADNGIVRILTAKGYRDAQEAAAQAPPPPSPRTTIIQKTA